MNFSSKRSNMSGTLTEIAANYSKMDINSVAKRLEIYREALMADIEFEMVRELQGKEGYTSLSSKEKLAPVFNKVKLMPTPETSSSYSSDKSERILKSTESGIEICDTIIKFYRNDLQPRELEAMSHGYGKNRVARHFQNDLTEFADKIMNIYREAVVLDSDLREYQYHFPNRDFSLNDFKMAKKGFLDIQQQIKIKKNKKFIDRYKAYFDSIIETYQNGMENLNQDVRTTEPISKPAENASFSPAEIEDVCTGSAQATEYLHESTNESEPANEHYNEHSGLLNIIFEQLNEKDILQQDDNDSDEQTGNEADEVVECTEAVKEKTPDSKAEQALKYLFEISFTPEEYKKAYEDWHRQR